MTRLSSHYQNPGGALDSGLSSPPAISPAAPSRAVKTQPPAEVPQKVPLRTQPPKSARTPLGAVTYVVGGSEIAFPRRGRRRPGWPPPAFSWGGKSLEHDGPGRGSARGAGAGRAAAGGGDCAPPALQPSKRTPRSRVPARGAAELEPFRRRELRAHFAPRPPKEALSQRGQALGTRPCPGDTARVRASAPRAAPMSSPGNRSHASRGSGEPPWAALLPCDERRCSPFPLGALVPVTAVCLGLFAVGVSGNVVTVLLIGRYRDMRTTTNLYLGSMAVSDLLILLGLPFDVISA